MRDGARLTLMFRFKLGLAAGLFILGALGSAGAHQPRLVGQALRIDVQNPEISQAFYAELPGEPQIYTIVSAEPFLLYLNLLVQARPDVDTDYTADVYKENLEDGQILTKLDGPGFEWTRFYEPFGGDTYLRGPEFRVQVPPGTYLVRVSSPDNRGKYVLAVGTVERFPPGEMIRTIAVLPKLKMEFFEKSPFTAYLNLSGVFLLVVVGGLTALGTVFF